jgi:hypothetical protein
MTGIPTNYDCGLRNDYSSKPTPTLAVCGLPGNMSAGSSYSSVDEALPYPVEVAVC